MLGQSRNVREARQVDRNSNSTAQKLLEGTANLAYEVGEEKSNGGESPYAGTSIVDMQENVEGIEMAYKLVFADTLTKADPKLASIIDESISKLEKLVKVEDIKSHGPEGRACRRRRTGGLAADRRAETQAQVVQGWRRVNDHAKQRLRSEGCGGGLYRRCWRRASNVGAVACRARTPVVSNDAVLPVGTELNEELLDQPTELFAFEAAGGKRSYLFNLGDMLFSSAAIFGGKARDAGMSCNSCHQQGAGNAKLFVPGLSSKPGTFDTTGALFNPKADNGVFDPVTPPSLRGAKYLAPYGHDGRIASLRDFIRNVIVNEFAGTEPSGQVLDALVTYVNEISLPAEPEARPRRAADQGSVRRRAPWRSVVQQAVPAQRGHELRRLSSAGFGLRRSQGARHRHRRLVQDQDAAQRQVQCAVFP